MEQVEERYISLLTDKNLYKLSQYEASKKAYRDIKNSVDTAKREGIAEGHEARHGERSWAAKPWDCQKDAGKGNGCSVGDGNYWSVGGADAAAESGILDDKYSQYQRAYMHTL